MGVNHRRYDESKAFVSWSKRRDPAWHYFSDALATLRTKNLSSEFSFVGVLAGRLGTKEPRSNGTSAQTRELRHEVG